MKKEEVISLFESFNSKTVLIIGDVMIDAYYSGKADRISPEAPVPIVHVTSSEKRLGGAANVARNIQSLGAKPILCSVIGDDLAAVEFHELLIKEGMVDDGILRSSDHVTTVKTRVISGSQHIVRIDEEEIKGLSKKEKLDFTNLLFQIMDTQKIDVVLFEDYDKGLMDKELINEVIGYCTKKGIPTCVDPKKNNFMNYSGITLFKPNKKELEEGLKEDLENCDLVHLKKAHNKLKNILHHDISLITLSEKGVFVANDEKEDLIRAHVRKISDVSGAGDTVISVASLCLEAGIDISDLAQISNLSGGLVCEKVGVVPIDKNLLLEESLRLCSE